jgi:hypothetical protein
MRPDYTYNAWNSLGEFFNPYIIAVDNNKLTLNPMAVGQPRIVESGIVENSNFFAGIHYWKVNQLVSIPELALKIDFTVLVVTPSEGQYRIV